ncbi:hypothetical protein AGABI1DRAFT_40522 [Agaricus bisporus var. burnettii JB137-S8]|uniref:Phenylacetyl-CoA ligase n=1 Tax=Agaricus bisporus var. burnettii (strain JB137-S8 / ATCC MYA-4627 / FGSC 10392) TaxID=597362 RepID=K5X804_AGABU|nr:uncharacterized protein AGABI1DRAFT_40522 [Agaricus bisporus var. burnettii JB137-S8]EKM79072.1 hypothetical protein AGABI1DRAFT_40522 [Agaricus bisporus var. burnettii JB137-S8]
MEFQPLKPQLPHIPDDLTIGQFVFDHAHAVRPKEKPGTPWLIEDATGRSIGKEELRERTSCLAKALRYKYNVGEDDVVLLFSRNHIDYPVAIWAVHQLGAIISGANPDYAENELLYQLQATKATILIAHPDVLSVAEAASRQYGLSPERLLIFNTSTSKNQTKITSIEDVIQLGRTHALSTFQERKLKPGEGKTKLAFLSFSSGTTGRPKAVAIPHYSPIANVIQIVVHNRVHEEYCAFEDRRYRPGDVALAVLPFYHIYGLVINLHCLLFSGMSLVVVPKFNFVQMLESIVRYKISHLLIVPPMVVLLCKHPAVKNYDIRKSVRMIMSGAAPLSHELNQQLFHMLPDAHIGQAYGMTETCTASTMWSLDRKRGVSGGSGTLLPGTIARIIKPDGTLAGYDEPGELWIFSPSNALGYLNNEEATRETFVDGWVRTGDEAKIRPDGEEIMKVKGFQVAPAELEGCILEHKDVDSTCVVGVPDEYSGEVPMAFVALRVDAAKRIEGDPREADGIKASIMKHVAENKVAYKHLAGGVEFVDVVPVSPSGKLLRRVLRERARAMKQREIKAKL